MASRVSFSYITPQFFQRSKKSCKNIPLWGHSQIQAKGDTTVIRYLHRAGHHPYPVRPEVCPPLSWRSSRHRIWVRPTQDAWLNPSPRSSLVEQISLETPRIFWKSNYTLLVAGYEQHYEQHQILYFQRFKMKIHHYECTYGIRTIPPA